MTEPSKDKRSQAEQKVIDQYGADARNRADFNDLVEQQLNNKSDTSS